MLYKSLQRLNPPIRHRSAYAGLFLFFTSGMLDMGRNITEEKL
jgi:hypothetical protein